MPSKALPAVLLALWCIICGVCLITPPGIDLPAHGAQMQTLAELIRGGPAAAYFEAHLSVGYGLTTWLFLPVTLLFNGAVAAKLACWLAMVATPVAIALLARQLGQRWEIGIFAAPMSFSVSYWYGFLPSLFAVPLVIFGWVLTLAYLRQPSWRRVLGLSALSTVVLLSHFIAFAAFAVGILAICLAAPRSEPRWKALIVAFAPSVLAVPRVWELIHRASTGAAALPTRYNLDAHLLGVIKQYSFGARVAVWAEIALVVLLVGVSLRQGRRPSRTAWLLAMSQAALWVVMPDDLAGSWRVGVRLAVFVAVAAVCLISLERIPRWAFAVPAMAVVLVLNDHRQLAAELSGLSEVTKTPPPPGIHGGFSLKGNALHHSRLALLEHQPQWWTARWGGIGTHFFADASHQPVQWRTEIALPTTLDAVLVFGEGELPAALSDLKLVQQAGRWRRYERANAR